jgi:beta-lactamase class A
VTRPCALAAALLLAACTGSITQPDDVDVDGDGDGDGDGGGDGPGTGTGADPDAAPEGPDPAELQALLDALVAEAPSRTPGTTVGLAARHLPSGASASAGGDTLFVSASAAKAWWVAAAIHGVGTAPVEPYAGPVFTSSDNSATGSVIDLVGADAVNDYTWDVVGMGRETTALTHWNVDKTREATNSPHNLGSDNYTTANDAVLFLAALHGGDALPAADAAVLEGWMRLSPRSGFGGWIGTPLPEAQRATLAHKAGWLPPGCCGDDDYYNTLNDVGIVTTPAGDAYAIAILTHGGDDYDGEQAPYVEHVSCAVYRFMADDDSIVCE